MLIKKLLTKDYFRRISWIELFGYKIDDEGNYIDQDSLNKSPYNNSNKSYSTIKDESDGKGGEKSNDFNKKPASLPKEPNKMKFYSEKYMNAMMQPIHNTKGTERKISLFA